MHTARRQLQRRAGPPGAAHARTHLPPMATLPDAGCRYRVVMPDRSTLTAWVTPDTKTVEMPEVATLTVPSGSRDGV